MKNFKKTLVVVSIVTLAATSALAYGQGQGQGKMGQGYNQNTNCPNYSQGQMKQGKRHGKYAKGNKMNKQNRQIQTISQDEANKKLNTFVASNLKGYQIQSIETLDMPRGKVYVAKVSDSNSNNFELRLNPFGDIRGPFVIK